ncbi:hypothetical protein QFZ23_002098 [Arthrobacter globiformis]|uniref:TetR/AcrR family transcriptional regulator n=1 Tax=Arthrobacter globiformis TaxID=1665 RepID=UPI0027891F07|nr:hypothetical protein [Arthrobacter globiformis]
MDRSSNHSLAGSAVATTAWPGPAERILQVALELFSRRGIRDVCVDELIALYGVAKSTFYRHFGSKDAGRLPWSAHVASLCPSPGQPRAGRARIPSAWPHNPRDRTG